VLCVSITHEDKRKQSSSAHYHEVTHVLTTRQDAVIALQI